ncbi:MAG: hypothetical protein RL088_1119, partial [Verrucomicrobiota bacterium]
MICIRVSPGEAWGRHHLVIGLGRLADGPCADIVIVPESSALWLENVYSLPLRELSPWSPQNACRGE